ncbi:MAG: zinc ribbon domain-containing protein [Oscillospiraceae bacterium]|nr:zinc ribbon domain-containing protein [Oscillospiraceae bacterium]
MKKCVQCGADLPDGASLCPYCAASQVERHTVSPPRRINRFRLRRVITTAVVTASLVGSAVAIVLGVRAIRAKERREAEAAALAALEAQQEAVENTDPLDALLESLAVSESEPVTPLPGDVAEGAEYPYYIEYTAENGQVYLLFAGMPQIYNDAPAPKGRWEGWAAEGGQCGTTMVLCAKRPGELPCPRELDALVASYRLEDVSGNAAVWLEPSSLNNWYHYSDDLLQSYLANAIGPAGRAVLRWTVEMKNGDVIYLDQVMDVSLTKEITVDGTIAPMDDAAALQRVIDAVEPLSQTGRYAVTLHLPAATYTEAVRFRGDLTVIGRGEDTVFAAGATVEDTAPQIVLRDVTFEGQGGVGLAALRPVILMGCRFSGWDTAVSVKRFTTIGADFCLFTDNTVGVEIDSLFEGMQVLGVCELRRNETAVRVVHMSRDNSMWINKCVFGENGTDIDNPEDYNIDMTMCKFT